MPGMGDLARQDTYGDVDWSKYNQPFGTLNDPNPVAYKTPYGNIYQSDVEQAHNLGGAFSGGGLGIKAYHGSPHSFEQFDLNKIGTGEGAQAYGHGLYFAEAEPVAQSYKRAGPAADAQYAEINGRLSQIAKDQDALTSSGFYPGAAGYEAKKAQHAANAAEYAALMDKRAKLGHMYEVDINADPSHFLDWDKPLPATMGRGDELTGSVLGRAYRNPMYAGDLLGVDRANPAELSAGLAGRGYPGIRYLDQGSRAARSGSSNYVVFNPNIVSIIRKYGIAAAPAGATMGGILGADQDQQ